jgi:CheY-like chemotaxis protein/nitrogen-specific signal transduction histidine kinase
VIKFANDLSERHAMEQDLRDAKAKAELAANAKSTFLANMSHEIRTPMNAILGFTEILLSEPATESQQRHLTTVRNSARSLLRLLNDILDTAKLDHGAMELEIHDFSLRDVCNQVIAAMRVNAQAKGLQLDLDYPATLPEFFKGDALRLQQVLINLVGNAIKFTDRGRVSLDVQHAMNEVRLCVSDTGIGIAPDRIARIFDPFAQADASMTRRFGGTGLGTTIARQLIEIMGGRIWVESELGVGSRFYIAVPLPAGAEVALAEDTAAIALPPLDILIADDMPQNLELLQIMLGRLGHRTTTASNGREAVQAFSRGSYDLVLMDVQMPLLDGLEATREIRRLEAGAGSAPTPIIALTASVLDQDAQAARNAGMNGFASKPVEVSKLTGEMARVLNLAVASEDTEFAVDADRIPMPSARQSLTIDWHRGEQLWGSRHRHLAAVRRFLLDDRDIVDRLRQRQGLPAVLHANAHRLKGAAGNLALTNIAAIALRLENVADSDSRNIGATLDQLADELRQVEQALVPLEPFDASEENTQTIDRKRLFTELELLDDALAHGELPEASLATVAGLLPPDERDTLDHAIDAFDFDAARQVILNLRQRYSSEGVAI